MVLISGLPGAGMVLVQIGAGYFPELLNPVGLSASTQPIE